jgi:NAD(P)-dependent dehydrogenase (short-subunit alcohol dehydrogenase family)
MSFSGRVALVTGAGSGIGRATALRLARDGAAVGVCDRDADSAADTSREIDTAGGRALTLEIDVTSDEQVAGAIAATVDAYGGLDAVAACAGVEVTGTVTSMELADWNRAIAIDLTGVMLTARHAVPELLKRGGGAFVAISSDAGIGGFVDWTPYAVAKHGVIGLIRCMALDYGPHGIRSNAVCPSFVRTPMADRIMGDLTEEEQRTWERMIPLGRFADPEEIATVIHHLLSPEASYTNGLVYTIDGGETAGHYTAGS